MTKTKRQGLTLIEVMLVLALSGILVVAALSTFRGRGSFMFQSNVRQVAENIRTVANETKSGLGPVSYGGSSSSTDPSMPQWLDTPMSSGEVTFGEALEFYPNCNGSDVNNWCLVVFKLKKSSDGLKIMPYERYPITVPNNIKINLANSTYEGAPGCAGATAIPSLSGCSTLNLSTVWDSGSSDPSTSSHLAIIFTNQSNGPGYVFARQLASSIDITALISSIPANPRAISDPSSYGDDNLHNQGRLKLALEDKNNANAKGFIEIDLRNPVSLQVSFP